MEDEHGRARVYDQAGDSDELVQEAIDTCPVNCIHYVSHEDLVILEQEREGQFINNAMDNVSPEGLSFIQRDANTGWLLISCEISNTVSITEVAAK